MARTLLSRVTEADPACVDAWLWLASISEYPEELLVFLKKVLDIEPANERAITWEAATRSLLAKTHVQRGAIANKEGNHAFAMQSFDEAISFDDACEAAWYWKASLTKDENEKLDCLAKILSINPDHADAREAVTAVEQARSAEKMHEVKRTASAGDLETAGDLLAEVLAAEPENCDAWILRVHLAPSLEEKFDAYDRILHVDPSNAFAQYGHNFLAELVGSVKPVETTEMTISVPEPAEEPTSEAVDQAAQVLEMEPLDHDNSDESEAEEASRQFEQAIDEGMSIEEPVAEEPWAMQNEPETYSTVAQFASEQPQFDEESVSLFEQDTMYFMPNEEIESASRDTAESIDPFERAAEVYEPISMVAEEAVREAELYASPTAETQEFRADEHNFEEIIAPEDSSELIDDTVVPSFSFESDTPAPASPWDTAAEYFEPSSAESTKTPRPAFEVPPITSEYACSYCAATIERQAFSCDSCHAVLSLSDIESLLANSSVNVDAIRQAVAKMEADWNSRDFSSDELKILGIGQFNLKNFDLGFAYIQEALRQDPNDVILAGQANALAIRLGEIKRQNEINEAMPKGKTILVVDDSATVRKLISSKLEKSGHQVICAVDGVEAMATIETMVPDLVLLDIAMPRMDGYQVCKLIRAHDAAKDVPVVMISGKDGFFDKVRGRMAGTTGYITKPFGPETLMKALETYLEHESIPVE